MKLLFTVLSGAVEDMQYSLAEDLVKRSGNNVEPFMLWMTKVFRRRKMSFPEAQLSVLMKQYNINPVLLDSYYRSLRYKDINLMEVIRVNMIDTPEVPIKKQLEYAIRYLYVCENLLKDEKIEGVVFLLGRGLFQRCLGYAARHLGIPTYYLCDAFIPGKTVHIWKNESECTNDLKGTPLPTLTEDQTHELKVFIAEQSHVKNIVASPYDARGYLKKIYSFIALLFSNNNLVGNRTALYFTKYEVLRIFRRYMAKKYYSHLDGSGFFFLPFQVMYDFHIPLFWAEYTNLEHLVDICRKALPPGYKLVVKEHPHLRGGVSIKTLRRISRMKDVILVDVDTDVQDILGECAGVITLCSSIGWQAMMHEKPVVCIHSRSHPDYNYYYADYGITFNVDEDDLGLALNNAVTWKPDQSRVYSFLYHVIFDRYQGSGKLCPVEYTRMADDIGVVGEYLLEAMK